MYNSEQKIRFINEQTKSLEAYYTTLFNAFEPYESKYNLDVAALPKEVVETVFSNEFGAKIESVKRMLNVLRAYHKWCVKNGITVCDNCSDVNLEFKNKIRKTMVASPMHLSLILDDIYDPIEDDTMDCVYRAFLWLIFAGMTESDAIEVLTKNVDWENMLIHHASKSYDIYKEAVPALRKACDLQKVVYKNPAYANEILRTRYNNDFLFRGVRSEKLSVSVLRGTLLKATKKSSMQINHRSILWSGIFYRQYELERIGIEPDFTSLAVDNIMRKLEINPDKQFNYGLAVSQTKGIYRRDYLQWKKAFAK